MLSSLENKMIHFQNQHHQQQQQSDRYGLTSAKAKSSHLNQMMTYYDINQKLADITLTKFLIEKKFDSSSEKSQCASMSDRAEPGLNHDQGVIFGHSASSSFIC